MFLAKVRILNIELSPCEIVASTLLKSSPRGLYPLLQFVSTCQVKFTYCPLEVDLRSASCKGVECV